MKPELFNIFGMHIYSYPLFMGLAWGMAYQLASHNLRRHSISLTGFFPMFWGAFISSWLGAKIFFLIYSAGDEYLTYGGSTQFWLGGGFVFYGGFIFGLFYLLIYIFIFKKFTFKNCAYLLPALCYGHAIGRLGCLLAGCCYGTSSDLPWSIHLHGIDRHPVQLYETIFLIILGKVLTMLEIRKISSFVRIMVYLQSYAIGRFILEYFRGDKIRGVHFLGLSTSQYVSAILFFIFGVLSLLIYMRAQKRT